MKTKETAGPYPLTFEIPLKANEPYTIVTAQGNHAATTYDPAMARLLISAPDLLAALKHILKTLPLDRGTDVKYLMAFEAIAKAEGR